MSKIDTVLFDFDGTVMDTNNVILMSWQHTFRTLRNREEKKEVLLKTFGEPLSITMRRFFPEVPTDEAVEIYRSFHRDNFGELISLFPGVKQMLRDVKERGYKTALVTSRLLGTTVEGAEKYGVRGYFDEIVTAEDTSKHKPDPEPINIALKKLGSAAANSIMIGDTNFDIMCAKNAGVESALVAWSMALDWQGDLEVRPDHIVHNPEDLVYILEKRSN